MSTEQSQSGSGTNFLFSGLCGLAAWHLWPAESAHWGQQAAAWSLAGMAGLAALSGSQAFARERRLHRHLRDSETAGTAHGSAREATEAELEARGMFDPASGTFLGFKFGRAVFSPPDSPNCLIEAPPGSGKDIYLCVGAILHRSLLGQSVLAPDVKLELGPMLIPGLRKMGVETWALNPARQFMDVCGNVELGLYQALLDSLYSEKGNPKDAPGIARELSFVHIPEEKGDGNKRYFTGGARRCTGIQPLTAALINPSLCTPAENFATLNDPKRFSALLKFVNEKLVPDGVHDPIIDFLKGEARNLLSRSDNNADNMGSFLEIATQALNPFNQAGYLAEYGLLATSNIREMGERPITAFPMTPHSHMSEFEPFNSLLNANLLSACKRMKKKQRVHLCLNEFLNYRIPNIGSELEVIRGLGVTCDIFIQSFSGLVRKYGAETAASVNDYCDTKVYMGLNSYERAKYVSDMLSEETITGKDYSYRSAPDDVNISSKRHGRRLMTTDEVLSMPRDQAWVFVKGLRPFRVHLAHYGHVDPWKHLVSDNPLEGPPLTGNTLLKIEYPRREP